MGETVRAIVEARATRDPHARFERCESCSTLVATSPNTAPGASPSLIERWRRPLAWEDADVLRSATIHTAARCQAAR